jgi:hypothetical protein
VKQCECLADDGIARTGQPSFLFGRQRIDVTPQRLDEQNLLKSCEHQPASRVRSVDIVYREADRLFEPVA